MARAQAHVETLQASPLPIVPSLCMGETRDGQWACVAVVSQGTKVKERELLAVSSQPDGPERAFEEALYQRFFLRNQPTAAEKLAIAREVAPLRGEDVQLAHGFGMVRRQAQWAVYEVQLEGDTLTESTVRDADDSWLYAWERLEVLCHRHLLRRDRRKA